jgi:hypothetical protein
VIEGISIEPDEHELINEQSIFKIFNIAYSIKGCDRLFKDLINERRRLFQPKCENKEYIELVLEYDAVIEVKLRSNLKFIAKKLKIEYS